MEGCIELTKDKGLLKKITKQGTGKSPSKGNTCYMNYVGKFENGNIFDQSESPFQFKLGAGQVIKGWDIGVETMKVGEIATLYLRYDYAYGERGYPGVIPPKATLIFDVELVNFQ
jgi:FKBP-type peptidyl-prolyl cis-trans isomerase